ncbi:hypothetical protein Lser_V15G23667 [Lactuca serriola]|uniref:Uncharacterized protein n=1 Tax=Lactuca sativa TaxID=4236 RepID=A0A9R1VM07_LACSA|nr:hypothetical protein LSAT_V11C500259710 [Lactuca sativa]
MGVNHDDEDLEALETLSLTDFPLTEDVDSNFEDRHHRPSSSTSEDLFEFFSGGLGSFSEENVMSHAEDMISGGKLIPINDQPHHDQPPPRSENQTRNQKQVHRRRSESMRELKSNTSKTTARQLVRNSHSLDYKKLQRNSRSNSEPTAEIHRNSLSNKTSSSRWTDLVFGPVKVPTEMDLRDIRNRQTVQNTSKSLFPNAESGGGLAVSRVGDHRKTSWGVLGILSCKSSVSVAVTMPLS